MACPPVRVDNQRALASGLSYVQNNYFIPPTLVKTLYITMFLAKVGKSGINYVR